MECIISFSIEVLAAAEENITRTGVFFRAGNIE